MVRKRNQRKINRVAKDDENRKGRRQGDDQYKEEEDDEEKKQDLDTIKKLGTQKNSADSRKSLKTCRNAVSIENDKTTIDSDADDFLAGKPDGYGGLNQPSFTIEYSTSSRSTCKRCDLRIEQDELRVASRPLFRGKPGYVIYKHLHCTVFTQDVLCAEDVEGYDTLSVADYHLLVERVLSSHKEIQMELEELEPEELVQKDFKGILRDVPKGLSATLLPFQLEGMSWMSSQERVIDEDSVEDVTQVRGGILADEMGMGKTLQTISLILDHKPLLQHNVPDAKGTPLLPQDVKSELRTEETLWNMSSKEWEHEMLMCDVSPSLIKSLNKNTTKKSAKKTKTEIGHDEAIMNRGGARAGSLVVCPVAALTQWKSEIEKFSEPGSLQVVIYHGPDRVTQLPRDMLRKYDVVLTTYQVLEADFRKMTSPNRVACPNCGGKFKIDKLRIHLKYFCGAGAVRTEAQARQHRNRDRQQRSGVRQASNQNANIHGSKNKRKISSKDDETKSKEVVLEVTGNRMKKKKTEFSHVVQKAVSTTKKKIVESSDSEEIATKARSTPVKSARSQRAAASLARERLTTSRKDDNDDESSNESSSEDVIAASSIARKRLTSCRKRWEDDYDGKSSNQSSSEDVNFASDASSQETLLIEIKAKKKVGSSLIKRKSTGVNKRKHKEKESVEKNNSCGKIKSQTDKSRRNKSGAKEIYGSDSEEIYRSSASSIEDAALKRARLKQEKALCVAKSMRAKQLPSNSKKKDLEEYSILHRNKNTSKSSSRVAHGIAASKGKPTINGSSSESNNMSCSDDSSQELDMDNLLEEAMAGAKMSVLHSFCWWRIVLDEAHMIKSRSSQTAAAAFSLVGIHRWCLSGTPLQNRVGEFYSLVRFLRLDPMAHYLCRSKDCNCKSIHYRMFEGRCKGCGHGSVQHYSHFNKRRAMFTLKTEILDKYVLRRTKLSKAEDMQLPPRLVEIQPVRLHPVEEDFYNALYTQTKSSFDDYVREGTLLNNYAHIFDLLVRMRQSVSHPYLVLFSKTETARNPVILASDDCGLCHEPPTDRVLTSCCRTPFCRLCVEEYIESAAETNNLCCPSCRMPFSIDLNQARDEIVADSTLAVNANSSVSRSDMPSIRELPHVSTGSILRRLDLTNFSTSTKIEALTKELVRMRQSNPASKAIVFSQFVNMLDLIRWRLHTDPFLEQLGLGVRALHGGMDVKARDSTLKDFREDPQCRILLMSLKAGGVALNLTVANYIFLMDPWWNPAAENQAIDRTHRLGQYRPIKAVRFIAEDTVEERILQLQEKKRLVFDGTVGRDAASLKMLTVEDMKCLFT